MSPTVGVLFMDAFSRMHQDPPDPWKARPSDPLLPASIVPPPGLVVVGALDRRMQVEHAGWLRGAARLHILLQDNDKAIAPSAVRALAATLGATVQRLPSGSPSQRDAAIRAACAMVGTDAPWARWASPPMLPCLDGAPGPWIPWRPARWHPKHAASLHEVVSQLAPQVCLHRGRPVLLDSPTGTRLDLLTGATSPCPGLQGTATAPVAACPGGQHWLAAGDDGWALHGAHTSPATPIPHARAVGVAPGGALAWVGWRAVVQWLHLTAHGPAVLSWGLHDWPMGHARKVMGCFDNGAEWVHLSSDGAAALSVFEYDALLCPGLPIRWRHRNGLAVPEKHRAGVRALLFIHHPGRSPGEPKHAEEDARQAAPTMTLGPDASQRYAVDLSEPVWRLCQPEGLAEPLPTVQAWAVYDHEHREVRRVPGRLLCGWDGQLTTQHGDRLLRHNLRADVVEERGQVGGTVSAAVAIPGTPWAVLIEHTAQGTRLRAV